MAPVPCCSAVHMDRRSPKAHISAGGCLKHLLMQTSQTLPAGAPTEPVELAEPSSTQPSRTIHPQLLARSVSGKGPGGLRRQESHHLATTMLPSSMRSYGMMDGIKKAVTEANAVRDKEVAEVRLLA